MLRPTRRDVLRALATTPLWTASACACRSDYPVPRIPPAVLLASSPEPILMPPRHSRRAAEVVIDTHAHFFNASDVPVRGFIAESMGHNAPSWLQPLIKAMAALAEKLADRAPTAFDELTSLNQLSDATRGRSGRELEAQIDRWFQEEREAAAERVAEVVRGTDFERKYREMVPDGARDAGRISAQEVLNVMAAARAARIQDRRRAAGDMRARAAKAKLEFLFYMLSKRASNVRTYIEAFSPDDSSDGIDMVLGALVDFDYWLDCPPRSAHEDQIALHQHLAALHGGFFRPVVAYNPWTDIQQNGAALQRVCRAWATGVFVAAKIYPPTGFMPAGNAAGGVPTQKRRPDLKKLDETLAAFFSMCAKQGIPVIAHAARSNGRDAAHDDFSSPSRWDTFLCRVAAETNSPAISLGHFGGDNPATEWTRQFASLMRVYPKFRIFADLGYWDHLMCDDATHCAEARARLNDVIGMAIGESEKVGDRVMFATDWLMVSQVPDWQAYPQRVRESLESIAEADQIAKIFGANAKQCFTRLVS